MFSKEPIKIVLTIEPSSPIKVIEGSVQPFTKKINFEDGYSIEITNRLFCGIEKEITLDRYIEVRDEKYKIMQIITWSDYLEVWLYKLK